MQYAVLIPIENQTNLIVNHTQSSTNTNIISCPACNCPLFNSYQSMKKHEFLCRYSPKYCLGCKQLRTKLQTNSISKTHRNEKKIFEKINDNYSEGNHKRPLLYICNSNQCTKSFNTIKKLNRHQRRHLKLYKCEIGRCCKSFGTSWDLKEHQRNTSVHCLQSKDQNRNGMKENRMKCKLCFKSYRFLSQLKEHMRIHLNEEEKNVFQCGDCLKLFGYKSNLRKHQRLFH